MLDVLLFRYLCAMVSQCFIYCHISTQKITFFYISLLGKCCTDWVLICSEHVLRSSCAKLFHVQFHIEKCTISGTFIHQSSKIVSCTFLKISDVVTLFVHPCGLSLMLSRPCSPIVGEESS